MLPAPAHTGPVRPGPRGMSLPRRAARRYAVAFHVLAAAMVFVATGAAYMAAVIVGISTDYCTPTGTDGSGGGLRVGLTVIGLVWAAVPLAAGVIARRYRMTGTVWFLVGGLMAVFTIFLATTVDPGNWCRFSVD